MENTGNNKGAIAKKPKKKALKIILGALILIILILIVGIIFAVPAYVSSESGKRLILAKANASGAGALDFANLSMSWGKGINISNLSFKDKGEGVSVAVKGFSTKPHYGALLGGNLSFGETVIDEPKVEINVDKMKKTSEEKEQKTEGKEEKKETGAGLPIGRIDLVVKDGDVKITGEQGKVEVSQINSKVNLRPEGEQSNFEVGANVAGGNKESTLSVKGDVMPGKGWGLEGTSGNVEIEVNSLDLGSLESILAIAGVEVEAKGVISANIKAKMNDGMIEQVNGNVSGKGLEATAAALKGDRIKTSVFDAQVQAHKDGDLMNVEKLTVATDWLKVEANGITPMSAASVAEFMKPGSKYELKANLECDIPALAAQLPKTLGIKEQTKLTKGKLAGSVATLSQGGQKKLAANVSIEGLTGMVEGKPIALSEPIVAGAVITADEKEVKFEKAGVTSSFATVNCSGTIESFNYDAQIDLAKLTSEIGQFADLGKYKLGGQVTSKGLISNNKNTTMVVAQSKIANLEVSPTADVKINEPNASVDLTAALDKTTNVLLVKQLKADTSLGLYSIKDGKIPTGEGAKETTTLTASARGVDLAKLQPYLVMTKAISKEVQLGGVAESDVTVGFKGGSYRITSESTKIANLMVKSPGKAPFTQNPVELVLDAEVNPTTKSWSVHKAEITSPNIKIKGTAEQKIEGQNSNIQGNAQLDYDWQTLSGMLSAFMPSELVIAGKRNDNISFSSRYPTADSNAMMANLNASAKVGFDKADYMGLHLGATNVDIKVDKGLLAIAPFTTVVNNGQLNFGGTADFKQKTAFFKTPGAMRIIKDVQINDEIANKLLSKINPIFANSSRVSGLANFDCNQMIVPLSGGALDQANVAGTVSLTKVSMQSGLLSMIVAATGGSRDNILTLHPTPFTVKDGFVRYQNMQMDLGNLPIIFGGIVPLDSNRKIENLSITLPVSATGKVIRTDSQTQTGRGSTLYVKGTPAKPELDIGKTVTEQAVKTGLEVLMQQAGKKK